MSEKPNRTNAFVLVGLGVVLTLGAVGLHALASGGGAEPWLQRPGHMALFAAGAAFAGGLVAVAMRFALGRDEPHANDPR